MAGEDASNQEVCKRRAEAAAEVKDDEQSTHSRHTKAQQERAEPTDQGSTRHLVAVHRRERSHHRRSVLERGAAQEQPDIEIAPMHAADLKSIRHSADQSMRRDKQPILPGVWMACACFSWC